MCALLNIECHFCLSFSFCLFGLPVATQPRGTHEGNRGELLYQGTTVQLLF